MNTTSTHRYCWEDFPVGHVMDFEGHPVSREAVIHFARQFDPQPFHLDDEAGAASVFGGLCASGWHTCAMAMRIMCDGYLLESSSQGSPGIDSLRWLKPVFPGDTLRLRMEVLEARAMNSKPHLGLVRSRWTLRNQHEEQVLAMEGWGMFGRRGVAAPHAAGPAVPLAVPLAAPPAVPSAAPHDLPPAAPPAL